MVVKYTIVKKAEAGEEIKGTLRQKKVAELVEKGGIHSKGKILSAAGYSKAVQKTPQKVFSRPFVARAVNEVILAMQEEREEILKLMKKKRAKANYAVLGMTLKGMNHDIELLDGRPTERADDGISDIEKAQLQAILARNRKK